MKKVLFILHVPPPIHGSAIVGKSIMESKTVNSNFYATFINLGTSKNLDEIGKGGLKKLLLYLQILIKIVKQLLFNRPDLVYLAITAKGVAFYKDMLVVFLAKIFRIKLVLHFHNKGVSKYQQKPIDNLLYKIAFKNTKVILLSKFLYHDVEKYVDIKDVYLCPNGIPINRDLKTIIKKDSEDNGIVRILFLSNLIKTKGVFTLLKACKILKSKELKFECIFIGGEGDINREVFEEKANALEISDVVSYRGPLYGKEKEIAYQKADIFAFPTYYSNETFGLVNLEAMQYALPIVSTTAGGIPDVVKDGKSGFLITKKKASSLAEKLEILINDKELREKMGKKGFELYMQKFTIKHFEENFTEILNKIVQN